MFKGGNFGGANINNLMKQAQKMQKEMEKAQEGLNEKIVEASSGGGVVSVVFSGKKELKEIKIKREVVDPDDVEMLEDLILTAINEGLRKADDLYNSEVGKIAGGIGGLPGSF